MATTVAKLVWLKGLFKEFGIEVNLHTRLFCDSKAAIQIAAHPIFHESPKHFDIDCHFVRLIQTQMREQQADLLTKGLCKPQHETLIGKLGMKNIISYSEFEGEC